MRSLYISPRRMGDVREVLELLRGLIYGEGVL